MNDEEEIMRIDEINKISALVMWLESLDSRAVEGTWKQIEERFRIMRLEKDDDRDKGG